jgi:AcrR family transcriptional regulator
VAKGLFYWYFPTKASLFGELVRTMRLSCGEHRRPRWSPRRSLSLRIRQGAEASVRFMAEHQPYFALLDVERTDDSLAEVMREGSDVYATDVRRLIEAAQRDGRCPTATRRSSRWACWAQSRRSATRIAAAGSRCPSTNSPTWWATGSCKH